MAKVWWILLIVFLGAALPVWAASRYYDIYLTGNRVCKKCTWKVLYNAANQPTGQVTLTNRLGESGTYPVAEILGVDNHPVWRKLLMKSVHQTGPAGRIIAPGAFDPEDKWPAMPDMP